MIATMLLAPGVHVGAHVEVFRDRPDGTRELVHTSRPGEVCGNCGADVLAALVIPRRGTPLCVNCSRRT